MGQVPVEQLGADLEVGSVVQNRDHCFTGRGAPHFGHRLGASRMDVTSNSNSWPHRLHRYSKMGMVSRARVQVSNGLAVRRHVEHGPLSERGFLHNPCQLRRMPHAQISVGPDSGGRNGSQAVCVTGLSVDQNGPVAP